jgi:hypothetical protein
MGIPSKNLSIGMVVFNVVMQGSSLHPNLGSVNMSTLTWLKRSAERSLVKYAIKVGLAVLAACLAVLAACNIKIVKVTCVVDVEKMHFWIGLAL